MLRFLSILKLLRVLKLKKIVGGLNELIWSDELMFSFNFIKIMGNVVFFAHWLACFYWAVGVEEMDSHYKTWITSAGERDK